MRLLKVSLTQRMLKLGLVTQPDIIPILLLLLKSVRLKYLFRINSCVRKKIIFFNCLNSSFLPIEILIFKAYSSVD